MRAKIIASWSLVVLAFFNIGVWQKEQILAKGETVILELIPVDPRSLMQGDYMILRYQTETQLDLDYNPGNSGQLILKKDLQGVARLSGIVNPQTPTTEDILLKYKRRNRRLQLGAESYFFQEGLAIHYDQARYGELIVDEEGNSILVGLRDKHLKPLNLIDPELE